LTTSHQNTTKTRNRPLSWLGVPPWILLGAVLILTPIFVFWAAENIRRQQEMTTLLLVEKGASLIRSFEAGARTGMMGMMGMRGTAFRLQQLLMETAQQPDVIYLIVTDRQGDISAHSDFERVGETYGTGLDLERLSGDMTPSWRHVVLADGRTVFEVYRAFKPTPGPVHLRHLRMRPRDLQDEASSGGQFDRLRHPGVIFVGLDTSSFEEARKEEARHTVVMAVILLLIGFAGLFSVFVVHAYRSARTSLSRVQAFSDHVVKSMPIGLVALDTNRRVATVNRTATAVLGLPDSELLGKEAAAVLPRELTRLLDKASGADGGIEQEISCNLPGGRTLPLNVSINVLEGQDGDRAGELLLFRDLTEVRNLKREVERSRRLAAVGRLAAGVAHEIRNPLSSIKGFATYFKERYRDVEEDRRTADIMIQEVDRLNRVIGQLLEFARPMAVEKRRTSLESLLRHALRMIEPRAREQGVHTEARVSGDMETIAVDPDRMGQVLLNLCLNSLEAMPEGGTLVLSAEPEPGGRGTRITVRDTGKGIAPEDLSCVFDPYFTTKPSGTGLGLAIVHKIVESHGGEVTVSSDPESGTKVSLLLPASEMP